MPLDRDTRARAVTRARRPLGPDVHRAIVAQQAVLAASPARDAHLATLRSGAAAVVTGQQVGLFLGPLYTIYKAASAIVLARTLAAETGTPVVPMFWLQTEDHDVVEIASCGVAAGTSCESVAVPVDPENRISIAHLTLPDEIEQALFRLAELLGPGPDAVAHLERLRRHYRRGASWSGAFAGVLAELFAPEGLIVIDPRDPTLAEAVAPVHARALDEAPRMASALIARNHELERAGERVQVHVRAGAPLAFFHPDGALGPRVRLEPRGDAYAEVGGDRVYERAALQAALAGDPRTFSTSALLRPIIQDTLLPTVAYIGGPGELAYFAQLGPLYGAFELSPPLVIQRASFRIVDDRARKLLARMELVAAVCEHRTEAELLARFRKPEPAAAASRLLDPFVAAHDELAATLAGADPAILRALAKTRASVERSIARFGAKLQRVTAYQDAELVEGVRRLRAWLAPEGEPQERTLGLPCFAARGGDRALVERILAAIDPLDPTLKELS